MKGEEIMNENETSELISQSTDVVLSAASSLVGFAIGGPVGAIIGSTLSPTAKLAVKAGQIWQQRRYARLTSIVDRAFQRSGRDETSILQELADSPDWYNTIIQMIKQLADSDPELDILFSDIMANTISTRSDSERNRYIILNNSIKGMNRVQILILKNIFRDTFKK